MPRRIALVVSSKMATLAELDSDLGSEDLDDLIEIMAVDSFNERLAAERAARN